MKILKRSITVLVCLILFTSCTKSIDGDIEKEYIERIDKGNYLITYYKGEPFTGEIFRNYDNGQLKAKINYTDGKYDGLSEGYYKNGQLKSKRYWKDGKLDGLEEGYYKNGQLGFKGYWKDGKKDGPLVYYNEDGSERWRE